MEHKTPAIASKIQQSLCVQTFFGTAGGNDSRVNIDFSTFDESPPMLFSVSEDESTCFAVGK